MEEGWKVEGSCPVCRPHRSPSSKIVKRPTWRAFSLAVADDEELIGCSGGWEKWVFGADLEEQCL